MPDFTPFNGSKAVEIASAACRMKMAASSNTVLLMMAFENNRPWQARLESIERDKSFVSCLYKAILVRKVLN
jgi:hypothetical protein